MNTKDLSGDYEFKLLGVNYNLSVEGEMSKLKSKITSNNKTGVAGAVVDL